MARRSNEESREIKAEAIRLKREGYSSSEIARELGITPHYVNQIVRGEKKALNRQDELIKEWRAVHRCYRQQKEEKRIRQQEAKKGILIPWEEYSKGPGWL